jgi:ABC-type spermidine/putrescine transport system permease subunit I
MLTLIALPMIGGAMIQTMGWMAMMMRLGMLNGILMGLGLAKNPWHFWVRIGNCYWIGSIIYPTYVLPL